jgi:hypothetical protein
MVGHSSVGTLARAGLPGQRDHQAVTKPRSPTTTGKIERFRRTLREEFLNHVAPFEAATAAHAIDAWGDAYNWQRPHQALDIAVPDSLFRPRSTSARRPRPHTTGRPVAAATLFENERKGDIALQLRTSAAVGRRRGAADNLRTSVGRACNTWHCYERTHRPRPRNVCRSRSGSAASRTPRDASLLA